MKQASWWLWTLSAVLVIACLAVPFMPFTALPFDVYSIARGKVAIKPSSQGIPLPVNLKPGDVIRFDQMDVISRIALAYNVEPPSTQIRLVVERANQVLHVPVQITLVPRAIKNLMLQVASIALIWLEVALGLLILWRSRQRAALGIALWSLNDAIHDLLMRFPMPAHVGDYLNFASTDLLGPPLELYGLFLVAEGLTSDTSGAWRTWIRRAFFLSLLLYIADLWIGNISSITIGGNINFVQLEFRGFHLLHIVCFALPIGMLLLAYRSASLATRLRMRWIFLSILMVVLSYLTTLVQVGINMPSAIATWLETILYGAALCGFTYAVLRYQLVPVRWVVNRTLVYAIVTSLVVSLFALVLNFMEHSALGTSTNRVVALIVALLLGMGLNSVKRQLDYYLNRLFFSHERRERTALNNLVRVAADINDREVMLDRAADELFGQSRARGLTLLLAEDKSNEMVRVRERGDLGAPDRINAHDPGLLQLKTGDKWVDLQSVKSALGTEGHVFPMRVGHELIGLVVCGPRLAGQRISDELKLLASVTLKIAALLYTLETKAQREFVLRVANGGSQIPQDIRTRAQALVGTRATI